MSDFRIGVVAGCLKQPGPAEAVAAAVEVGAECLQVSNRRPTGTTLDAWVAAWRGAAAAGNVVIASGVTGFAQEDYSSIEAIHRTGGLVPDDSADGNIANVFEAIAFTRGVGADLLTFHAGFIPETPADPVFGKLVERIGRCADQAAGQGMRIGLESGQESAAALNRFLAAVNRPNVGVNLDPANMILYGRQSPLDAVDVLAEHVFQVHAKDGTWSSQPGVDWGKEVPLGSGAVDFAKFVEKLIATGVAGRPGMTLIIEREAGSSPLADIRGAVRFLREMRDRRR